MDALKEENQVDAKIELIDDKDKLSKQELSLGNKSREPIHRSFSDVIVLEEHLDWKTSNDIPKVQDEENL